MRHHTRTLQRAALPFAFAVVSWSAPALGFKEPGHRAIEAAAYRQLLAKRVACEQKKGPCDQDARAIQILIEHGVLKPPARPLAVNPEGDQRELTVAGLVVESHMPDHLFDRQLNADRQCFHFNARGEHLTRYETQSDYLRWGVPRGLVEDAYIECLGVADGLLRSVLLDPSASNRSATGVYALMHMLEDSFSEAHVARDANNKILYLTPWNLRTWLRYFFTNAKSEAVWSHFSSEHHMTSDTRDLGYLKGPRDSDYIADGNTPGYRQGLQACLRESEALLGADSKATSAIQLLPPGAPPDVPESDAVLEALEHLEGDLVVPPVCLSRVGRAAEAAVTDLLLLIARVLDRDPQMSRTGVKRYTNLESEWLHFRQKHLDHLDRALTTNMSVQRPRHPSGTEVPADSVASVRDGYAYNADDLAPENFRELGAGLSTELRTGTPLWIGVDGLLMRNAASHYKTSLFLDSLGWAVQLRLPIENELGEHPVGVAADLGIGLPIPLSELLEFGEIQVYVGARARFAYTAQSVFETETRHLLEIGFGGVSLDFIIGDRLWLGLDGPRKMFQYDAWKNEGGWQDSYLSLSAGVALDAF